MKLRNSRLYTVALAFGVIAVVGTAVLALSGCASQDTMSTVSDIHSMTPCGMMMDAMMGGHNHGGQSQPPPAPSSAYSTGTEPAADPYTHAH
ncbi:MAG: hypothetical protein HY801_09045 [Candidatus Lindowbacteria bacterium]|nr:hypothetical protein [Candidatus Lindowbacteria bacterium]